MFKQIDDRILVAGQIEPSDIAAAKAEGVTFVVNNRPEQEAPGQPSGAEIEAAAKAAGLGYVAIPITHAGFSEDQVTAMADILAREDGKLLAFCRSGTRSTLLWALARSQMGDDAATLAEKAAAQGYDLSPIMGYLARPR